MYTLMTVMLIIMSSSAEPFLSAWACGVDILIHAITDSAMVESMGSSVRLLELKSQLCQLLSL